MARQTNLNIRKTFSALWPPSSLPSTTHWISALCIEQTFPIGGNTFSTIKGDILLTPRQLLER